MIHNIKQSPVDEILFNNQKFFVKRDDLLHIDFSGNKARKFYFYFINSFPNITKLISYGSNQSNAMYSLSVLCAYKNWEFEYYTDHIPTYLMNNPQGNYKYALANGMNMISGKYDKNIQYDKSNTLFIPEGGATLDAQYGIELLANEIIQWKTSNNLKDIKVFLPSGTGSTALFLQKFLCDEVLTCPCVGDAKYLRSQFLALDDDLSSHPTILQSDKKYHFGKLYQTNYEIYKELYLQTNIEFDLLYDPIGWKTILQYNNHQNMPILYIHQGGIKGNETMLARYKHKYNN